MLGFQQTGAASLRRPWQTFKNGQIWYGYTKLGSKRHQLTTKQGNKDYYKGTRSSGYGKLNKSGIYIIDWRKVRTYVVPSTLLGTNMKALVSPNVPQIYQKFTGYWDGPKSPELAWHDITSFIEHGENYNDQDLEKADYLEEFINPDTIKEEPKEA